MHAACWDAETFGNGGITAWYVIVLEVWRASAGKVGRSAAIAQVAVPKAQMVPKQDWSYVAGATTNLQGAHQRDDDITSLCFSSDGNTLLSRSCDDTLKVGARHLVRRCDTRRPVLCSCEASIMLFRGGMSEAPIVIWTLSVG